MSDTAVLSTLQRRTLAAAVARVLPAEEGVGAAEAGVAEYLAAALGHRSYRAYVRPLIAQGLDLLQDMARQAGSQAFDALSLQEQDTALMRLQEHPHAGVQLFLNLLVHLTLEGFLCDPVHGGNRGAIGWRAIGYDGEGARTGFCQRRTAS